MNLVLLKDSSCYKVLFSHSSGDGSEQKRCVTIKGTDHVTVVSVVLVHDHPVMQHLQAMCPPSCMHVNANTVKSFCGLT